MPGQAADIANLYLILEIYGFLAPTDPVQKSDARLSQTQPNLNRFVIREGQSSNVITANVELPKWISLQ